MAPKLNSQKMHSSELHVFLNICKEQGVGEEKIRTMAMAVLREMHNRHLSFEDNVRPYLALTKGELTSGFCHDTLIFDFCKEHDLVVPVRSYIMMFAH